LSILRQQIPLSSKEHRLSFEPGHIEGLLKKVSSLGKSRGKLALEPFKADE